MSLDTIVNLTITKETETPSQVGFATMLILGDNLNVNSRTQVFTDLTSVALAITGGTTSLEYKAAQAAFSQNPRVTQIIIGHRQGQKINTYTGTFTAGSIKTTVNGILITTAWATDKDTTLTAHAAAIQAGVTDVLTAVYGTGVLTLTPKTGKLLAATNDLSLVTGTLTVVLSSTGTEGFDAALDAIKLINNDWYALVCTNHVSANVQTIAAWIEANKKVYATSSAITDIVDLTNLGDTTTIAAILKAAAYDRTALFYHPLADSIFPEAAMLGKILPYDPGSYTVMFKTLAGIAKTTLTSTQSTNALAKKCNTYEEVGGLNLIQNGTMASGEFIDVTIFIDWLEATMKTDVFRTLKISKKVPYTTEGILSIKNAMESSLKTGQDRGGISPLEYDDDKLQIGGYYITMPKIEDVPIIDKANRILNNVQFTAFLAGAIHKCVINGIVTY